MLHGLAGFHAGCRCTECASAKSDRIRRIVLTQWVRLAKIKYREACTQESKARMDLATPPNHRKPWSAEEIRLAMDTTLSTESVAQALGRSRSAVQALRYRRRTPNGHDSMTTRQTGRCHQHTRSAS